MFTPPTKVAFKAEIHPWEDYFYPSVARKIRKSKESFNSIFEVTNTTLTTSKADNFLELYKYQIANKKNYLLDVTAVEEKLYKKVQAGSYQILGFNYAGQFAGGIVYRILEAKHIASVIYRVFDRDISRATKARTTLDYWAESVFQETVGNLGCTLLSHGRDNYPRKSFGLALFKMAVGMRPEVSKGNDRYLKLSDEELKSRSSNTFFFDKPDSANKLQRACLYYRSNTVSPDFLKQAEATFAWTNIEFVAKKT